MMTRRQASIGTAPLNHVYVAHGERMQEIPAEDRHLYASADACFIGQNVYLFCASEGLRCFAAPSIKRHWRKPCTLVLASLLLLLKLLDTQHKAG